MNKKLLTTAILLVLAKSAFSIEVEPNNDSSKANSLGKENSGKLNRASDVDFFSIDSCIKDDKKQCLKYTADEKLDSIHKADTDKRREEVSVSFTCNNKSSTSTGGWFLGIHDANGELQETYQVKPEDCVINDTHTIPFNFRFPSLESPNYYVSVVSDCAAPMYNTVTDPKDSTKILVNVNKFVTAALAKQTDIDAAKFEVATALQTIGDAQKKLDFAEKGKLLISTPPDIYYPPFLFINSNANIKNLTDAFALASDITSLASTTLTPATNVSAAMSVAKAVQIAANGMQYSIYTYGEFLIADVTLKAKAGEVAETELDAENAAKALSNAEADFSTASTASKDAADALRAATKEKSAADTLVTSTKSAADNAAKDLTNAQSVLDKAASDKKADAQTKVDAAKTAKDTADKAYSDASQVAKKAETDETNAKLDADKAASNLDKARTARDDALKAKDITDRAKLKTDKYKRDFDNAKAEYDESKTKLDDSMRAVDDAVKSLNNTAKANIDAANAAENFVKRFDSDACKNYNVGIYTLKDNPDNEIKRLEDITSKEQKNLGLEQSGQISSLDDLDIYVVDSDGTADVPLLFTCSAMAFRQTNNWKVSIFNDANGLVNTTLINGSSCGSVFIGDKGGQSVKLPKGSQRYYLAVESACASSTKKDCVVDTSEYSILRDVDKVYSGKLVKKTIDTKTKISDLKLTNCGLNNNAVISIRTENVNLTDAAKLPINVQIGSTACRILTPELSAKDTIIGSIADASEIIDSTIKTKDSAAITLNDCGSDAKSKVIITGSRLDLVNLNPNNEADSAVIPIKVNIGDFRCESKEVFAIDRAAAETTYSNKMDASETAITATPTVDDAVVVTDPITALATATNISASQTNRLKSVTDIQAYYVDNNKSIVDFEFSCPDSVRFTNDWTLATYDAKKKLISNQMIDGSACGTGKAGDTGTFKFSSLKNSTRSYFVVKSACETGDSVCVVDSSQYQIKRIIPTATTSTTTSSSSTSTTAPCFYSSCTTPDADAPIFGAK